ncbi:hypothetical protein K474DRAFT_1713929, partial [Panus rudis PR-1116 ss-1]
GAPSEAAADKGAANKEDTQANAQNTSQGSQPKTYAATAAENVKLGSRVTVNKVNKLKFIPNKPVRRIAQQTSNNPDAAAGGSDKPTNASASGTKTTDAAQRKVGEKDKQKHATDTINKTATETNPEKSNTEGRGNISSRKKAPVPSENEQSEEELEQPEEPEQPSTRKAKGRKKSEKSKVATRKSPRKQSANTRPQAPPTVATTSKAKSKGKQRAAPEKNNEQGDAANSASKPKESMGPPTEIPERHATVIPRNFPSGSHGADPKDEEYWEKLAEKVRQPKKSKQRVRPLASQTARDTRAVKMFIKEGAPQEEIKKLKAKITREKNRAHKERAYFVEENRLREERERIMNQRFVFQYATKDIINKKPSCYSGARCIKAGKNEDPPARIQMNQVILIRYMAGTTTVTGTTGEFEVYYHAHCLTDAQYRKIRNEDPTLQNIAWTNVGPQTQKMIKDRIMNAPDGPGHEQTTQKYVNAWRKILPASVYRRQMLEVLDRKLYLLEKSVAELLGQLSYQQRVEYIDTEMQRVLDDTEEEMTKLTGVKFDKTSLQKVTSATAAAKASRIAGPSSGPLHDLEDAAQLEEGDEFVDAQRSHSPEEIAKEDEIMRRIKRTANHEDPDQAFEGEEKEDNEDEEAEANENENEEEKKSTESDQSSDFDMDKQEPGDVTDIVDPMELLEDELDPTDEEGMVVDDNTISTSKKRERASSDTSLPETKKAHTDPAGTSHTKGKQRKMGPLQLPEVSLSVSKDKGKQRAVDPLQVPPVPSSPLQNKGKQREVDMPSTPKHRPKDHNVPDAIHPVDWNPIINKLPQRKLPAPGSIVTMNSGRSKLSSRGRKAVDNVGLFQSDPNPQVRDVADNLAAALAKKAQLAAENEALNKLIEESAKQLVAASEGGSGANTQAALSERADTPAPTHSSANPVDAVNNKGGPENPIGPDDVEMLADESAYSTL